MNILNSMGRKVSKDQQGYSMMEMIVVIAIIAILAAVAIPNVMQMRQGLEYRQAARDIANIMRDARNRAVTTNRQHRVELDPAVPCRRYRISQGDREYNSAVWNPVTAWQTVPQNVNLSTTPIVANFEFNPNGTVANFVPMGITNVTINIVDKNTLAIKLRDQVTSIGKISTQ